MYGAELAGPRNDADGPVFVSHQKKRPAHLATEFVIFSFCRRRETALALSPFLQKNLSSYTKYVLHPIDAEASYNLVA